MEPEMEDKTLELMVRRLSLWHLYHRCDQCEAYVAEATRVSVDGRNGAEAACSERWRRKEGAPEIRGRA